MIQIPDGLQAKYDAWLATAGVPAGQRRLYRKWLRFYLDFCKRYGHAYAEATSLEPFLAKLASKRQTQAQRSQAAAAVAGYHGIARAALGTGRNPPARSVSVDTPPAEGRPALSPREPAATSPSSFPKQLPGTTWQAEYDALRDAIGLRNYSPKTLRTYTHWVRKLQAFVRSRSSDRLSTEDVKAFLTDLAVRGHVSASTQNQAFNALLFFFRHVLGREFGKVEGVVRAKRRPYIPVVLSRDEVHRFLDRLPPPYTLPGKLLYGCGLRISECLQLRVNCINIDDRIVTVHDGKGQKDRTVPLPEALVSDVAAQLDTVAELLEQDLAAGFSGVFLPGRLEKKLKGAATEYIWQWLFPAATLTTVPESGGMRRYHMHPNYLQKAVKQAASAARIPKRVTPHTLRHTFASHLLQANYDIRTIQEMLGHSDVKTTMVYTHTVPSRTKKERRSPLDF